MSPFVNKIYFRTLRIGLCSVVTLALAFEGSPGRTEELPHVTTENLKSNLYDLELTKIEGQPNRSVTHIAFNALHCKPMETMELCHLLQQRLFFLILYLFLSTSSTFTII